MVVVAIYPFNSAGSFVQRVVFSLTKLLSSRYPRDRCNHTWRLGENSRDRCNDAWPLGENARDRCNETWPLGENSRDRCDDTWPLSKKSLHLNATYAPRSKTFTAKWFCSTCEVSRLRCLILLDTSSAETNATSRLGRDHCNDNCALAGTGKSSWATSALARTGKSSGTRSL